MLVGLLGFASPASAAKSQLWHVAQLDAIGQQLSGYPDLQVTGEDDPYEWGQVLGLLGDSSPAGDVTGYARIFVWPGSYGYHSVFIGPQVWSSLVKAIDGDWSDEWNEAFAVLTLIHESYHYRLFSIDEGRVNACAIRDFPAVIADYFNVQPVVSQPSQVEHDVPIYRTVKRVSYVRVKGKRVRRIHHVRVRVGEKLIYVDGPPVDVANPVYVALVADAQAQYNGQPPPYSTGVCS